MTRDKLNYSHGDTGNEPQSALDFQKNERPKAQHFDWWWYNVIQAINGHADEFHRLDSNDDGVVDEADYAQNAGALEGKTWSDLTAETDDTSISGFEEFRHDSQDERELQENGSTTLTTKVTDVTTDEVLLQMYAGSGSDFYDMTAEIYLDGVKDKEYNDSTPSSSIEKNHLIPMDTYNEIRIEWQISWGQLAAPGQYSTYLEGRQDHTQPRLVPHSHGITYP